MKYIFAIYLIFQVVYDHWATEAVPWQCAYFAAQWMTLAAIAFIEAQRGRHMTYYLTISLLMCILAINELTWITSPEITYQQTHGGPPVFAFTIMLILTFLNLSRKWINRIKSAGRSSQF